MNVNTGVFTLSGTTAFSNDGQLNLAGTSTLNLDGIYTKTTLEALLAPTHFTRTTGSTINFTGSLDLGVTGTVDIGSAGVFGTGGLSSLGSGGVISNGTLINTDVTQFKSSGGTLTNMVIGSNLTTDNGTLYIGGNLTLASGVTVNKGSGTWYWNTGGSQTLGVASGTATLNSTGGHVFYRNNSGVNTFNLGSGLTVQGSWSIYETNTNSVSEQQRYDDCVQRWFIHLRHDVR